MDAFLIKADEVLEGVGTIVEVMRDITADLRGEVFSTAAALFGMRVQGSLAMPSDDAIGKVRRRQTRTPRATKSTASAAPKKKNGGAARGERTVTETVDYVRTIPGGASVAQVQRHFDLTYSGARLRLDRAVQEKRLSKDKGPEGTIYRLVG